MKKVLIMSICLLLISLFLVDASKYGKVDAMNEGFTATKTVATIGESDGVKDSAYDAATIIPISHVAWDSENANPATANMYLLWDTSYLYVFVEVTDVTHIEYVPGTWIELNDSFEMMLDLYHNTSYDGGYGGDYRGDKMCEGLYKIAAGVGRAGIDSTVQGMHWLWDDQKNNGSYASVITETGYTVEYKIALGKDASEFMVTGREIGLGAKIYDRHDEAKYTSKTVLEPKNDTQLDKPSNLSSVLLVENPATEKVLELFNKYYNLGGTGVYTKDTTINVDVTNENVIRDVEILFHGSKDISTVQTSKVTYYNGENLWFADGHGYGVNAEGKLTGIQMVDGRPVVKYNHSTLPGMEEYYLTLDDFVKGTHTSAHTQNNTLHLLSGWVEVDGVYYNENKDLIKAFILFTAPTWLFDGTDENVANYVIYTKVSLEESNGNLIMKLWVSELNSGILKDVNNLEKSGNDYLFSSAVISNKAYS